MMPGASFYLAGFLFPSFEKIFHGRHILILPRCFLLAAQQLIYHLLPILIRNINLTWQLGGKKIALRGGGGWHGSPFAQPPLPLLGRRTGRGVWAGAALPAMTGGGGGATPTYMAQNDPRVALIILTTHMWGKIFS